jgi:DNA-binding transcriptional ArsR family regulator
MRAKPLINNDNYISRRQCECVSGTIHYSTKWLTIIIFAPNHIHIMTDLDATFAALADPTRRAILSMLLEDDMAVTDVAEPFDMSLAAISKHLIILQKAGLISQEKARAGKVVQAGAGRATRCQHMDAKLWSVRASEP